MDGIVVINKPAGITSSRAVQLTGKLFPGSKAGHTGTLDPLATGVLPVCLNRATRLVEYIIELPKTYRAEVVLGKVSDTGDAEGIIIPGAEVPPLTFGQLEAVLSKFKGAIEQLPPFYSAVKHRGKPLYHWTRRGQEVPRKLRMATIYELELLTYNPAEEPRFTLNVRCSKGTYIRTLAADIGEAIGCGAYLSALIRSAVGPYTLEEALTPEQAAEMVELGRGRDIVKSMDSALLQFPRVTLEHEEVEALKNGLVIKPDNQDLLQNLKLEVPIRLYDKQDNFKALVTVVRSGDKCALKTLKFLMQ